MQIVHFSWGLIWYLLSTIQVIVAEYNVTLSHDGPIVLGGTITFKVDFCYDSGEKPSGTFKYKWRDNALSPHKYETKGTSNTTTYWSVSYPREDYNVGIYEVEVVISQFHVLIWRELTSVRSRFYITEFLNGEIEVTQTNNTLKDMYVSSTSEANVTLHIHKGDMGFLKNATSVSTYWFIDCKYYGQTSDLSFFYNFTNPDTSHEIEALVVASHDPPTTTTLSPPTSTTVPSVINVSDTTIPNITTEEVVITTLPDTNITTAPRLTTTTSRSITTATSTPPNNALNSNTINMNMSLPFICLNTIIPPDPNKTYGHFTKKINVRAPIMNITVEGTNWIQPWDMLSLNVTCKGSGPFNKCLYLHRGKYNVTGNETCDNGVHLHSCNFSIIHYFLEPSVYTILIIMNNDVSKQIYPLTINIYKVTTKPQLSVIVVPVSCSLAAVVLIVFGIAYYIQSRARFTVEVADFDFGQNNPEMEYKTFTERLRDSFNNTIRPGNKRINGYKPLSNPEPLQ